MQAKAWKKNLAFTLEHVMAEHLVTHWVVWRKRLRIGDKLSDVEAYAPARPKAHTLAEVKTKTLKPYTSDIKAMALLDTLADIQGDTRDLLGNVKGKALNNSLA